jgi:DNA polymerase III sliding clamp (beta) subunit (PCNA family)
VSDPFTLLPANLGAVAGAAARDNMRYSLSGVHVRIEDGAYRVCATDGKIMALVSGHSEHDPLDYPAPPELVDAPPSAPQAVIPAREWKQAFRDAPRARSVSEQPILGSVAVHLGATESILASTDLEQVNVARVANDLGRFPDYEKVIPAGAPRETVQVNADLLLDLLKIALAYGPGDDLSNRLTLEFHGPGKPLVLRTSNGGQQFLGLLMPLQEVPAVGRNPGPAVS